MSQFSSLVFATRGITPLGYAAFAFALGVTVGALIRRTVPAMAVTLAIFAAAQIAMPLWIRPLLFPASHTTVAIARDITFSSDSHGKFVLTTGSLPGQPEAWVVSSRAVNAAGHPVTTAPPACLAAVLNGGSSSSLGCLTSQGVRIGVTYQPASRYWAFQAAETAIYLALALALAGYSFRRLGRRLSSAGAQASGAAQPLKQQVGEGGRVLERGQVTGFRPVDAPGTGDPLDHPCDGVLHHVKVEPAREDQRGNRDLAQPAQGRGIELLLLDVIPVGRHLERPPLHAPHVLPHRGVNLASGTARALEPPRQVRLDRRVDVAALQRGPLRVHERQEIGRQARRTTVRPAPPAAARPRPRAL